LTVRTSSRPEGFSAPQVVAKPHWLSTADSTLVELDEIVETIVAVPAVVIVLVDGWIIS
jgi:hypothetical protein